MAWELKEAMAYYKGQGAPRDQGAAIALLKDVQAESGGIPGWAVGEMAAFYEVKESYFLALIRRIPSLRLQDSHMLEVCAGPNCGRAAELHAFAEGLKGKNIQVKFVPCMRMCGKGPNVKWDGQIYHKADKALLERLTKE